MFVVDGADGSDGNEADAVGGGRVVGASIGVDPHFRGVGVELDGLGLNGDVVGGGVEWERN
jgi:hypothetical protein